ncbi:MAG: YggS family pyridoxal phosphate-dependent enzyme [Planctomycetaceae bacterium]|nr:YggS family pyridoxal phosphate-dependent enzyme [Planctomycetaceae bacterium]
MNAIRDIVARNLKRVRQRIDAACERSGRDRSSVRLVAVTKYAQPEWVDALIELGVTDLGESRPQQLIQRVPRFPEHVCWHLIGHLQRNKVRGVLPLFGMCHSIDSVRLLARIDLIASELKLPERPRLLLEVNVSGEDGKDGFDLAVLETEWSAITKFENVQPAGLMTMAPLTDDVEECRPVFGGLRALRDRLVERTGSEQLLGELSMGMSRDFEIAIEEGATLVRVGRTLFEGLERPQDSD